MSLAILSRWGRARGLRWSAWAAALALLAFHARLLLERLADGTLGDPAVALQWAAAAAVLAWLVRSRRRGASLLAGRRALTFWVLVLLLHAVPAMPGGADALQADGGPVLLVAPLGLALAGAAALLARLRSRRPRPVLAGVRLGATRGPGRSTTERRYCLAPRAPPV